MTDQDIIIEDWLEEDVPEEAVELMNETASIPFGTALWSS